MGRHRVAIVVLGGTFVLDLAVAVQAFGRRPSIFAKIREEAEPPYEVVICGHPSTPTSLGFSIGELESYEVVAGADTVLVPGTEYALDPLPDELHAALVAAHQSGARMVSLCAGAFVLGQAGVLDGHRVTTHWAMANEFRAAFPRDAPGRARPVRRRRTGALLRRHARRDGPVPVPVGLRPRSVVRQRRLPAAGQPAAPGRRTGPVRQGLPAARRPVRWPRCWPGWRRTSREPFSVAEVAARAHMSQRTLVRRFRAETGEGLAEWVARHRIERARALLEETDLPVAQVAHDAGFGSVEALRRHFQARVGTSPRAYRDTFRAPPAVTSRSRARESMPAGTIRRDTARTAARGEWRAAKIPNL